MQKSLIALGITFLISILLYSKDTLTEYFPELKILDQLVTAPVARDVKGDATGSNVVRVVDGDTIVVKIEGHDEKVRLIGINSPETVDPRKPVECFGKEAKEHLQRLLSGANVRLEDDPSQQDKDKYNRFLRYIFLSDGTFVNLLMVGDGYAYEYTYEVPYKYQQTFKDAQQKATEQGMGLWNKKTCNGEK
ncbi:MAG: thermonuclease family protein [bacterium]|nr:thermonuclease family protein [bacterium]